jgi:hypothetical protein
MENEKEEKTTKKDGREREYEGDSEGGGGGVNRELEESLLLECKFAD